MATPKVSLKTAKDPAVAETEELTESGKTEELSESAEAEDSYEASESSEAEDSDEASDEASESTDSAFEKASFRAVKFPIFNPYLNVTFSTESFSDPVDFDGYNRAQVDAGLLEVKVSE